MWQVCIEVLPTPSKLMARKVINDSLCPICRLYPETVSHGLRKCEVAKAVWGQSIRKLQKMTTTNHHSFSEIWQQMIDKLNQEELAKASFVAKQIWWRRNYFVFHSKFRHSNVVLAETRKDYNEYKESCLSFSAKA